MARRNRKRKLEQENARTRSGSKKKKKSKSKRREEGVCYSSLLFFFSFFFYKFYIFGIFTSSLLYTLLKIIVKTFTLNHIPYFRRGSLAIILIFRTKNLVTHRSVPKKHDSEIFRSCLYDGHPVRVSRHQLSTYCLCRALE